MRALRCVFMERENAPEVPSIPIRSFHSQNTSNVFRPLRRRNLKTQQSPVILDLCLRKTRSVEARDYRDVIVFEKLRFQIVFRAHENEKPARSNAFSESSVFMTD